MPGGLKHNGLGVIPTGHLHRGSLPGFDEFAAGISKETLDGNTPVIAFQPTRDRYAIDFGSGLQPVSEGTLAGLISSTAESQYMQTGIGYEQELKAVNALRVSRAGFFDHDEWIRPHGDCPSVTYIADNYGDVVLDPETWMGQEFTPVRVASQGETYHRIRTNLFLLTAADQVSVSCIVRIGTSGRMRFHMRDATNSLDGKWDGVPGALTEASTGAGTFDDGLIQIELADGVWFIAGVFTCANNSTDMSFNVGPDSAVVGEDIDVIAMQVVRVPYVVYEWIRTGSTDLTITRTRAQLDCDSNSIDLSNGFAFIADLDLKGLDAGIIDRFIEWNSGDDQERISLLKNTGEHISLDIGISGSYVTGAGLGDLVDLLGPERIICYGIVYAASGSDGYLRLGVVGYGDSSTANITAFPAVTHIGFDGRGFVASNSRAYKYLKRFQQWSVDSADDTVYAELKAMAESW